MPRNCELCGFEPKNGITEELLVMSEACARQITQAFIAGPDAAPVDEPLAEPDRIPVCAGCKKADRYLEYPSGGDFHVHGPNFWESAIGQMLIEHLNLEWQARQRSADLIRVKENFKADGWEPREQKVGLVLYRLLRYGEVQDLPSERLRKWRQAGGREMPGDWRERTEEVQSARDRTQIRTLCPDEIAAPLRCPYLDISDYEETWVTSAVQKLRLSAEALGKEKDDG